MNVLRACVLTAVVATTLSLGASIALFGEDNTARETRDRHEIEALMWKYTRALDKGDGATYASTYTVDGQFGSGRRTRRRAARRCRSWSSGSRPPASRPGAAVSHGAEPLDRVRGQGPCSLSRLLPDRRRRVGTRDAAADSSPPGRASMTMERVNGKWLLKTRDVAAKD